MPHSLLPKKDIYWSQKKKRATGKQQMERPKVRNCVLVNCYYSLFCLIGHSLIHGRYAWIDSMAPCHKVAVLMFLSALLPLASACLPGSWFVFCCTLLCFSSCTLRMLTDHLKFTGYLRGTRKENDRYCEVQVYHSASNFRDKHALIGEQVRKVCEVNF